jgi:hypothetical protein
MPCKRKRRRDSERPTIHPKNKYAENPPDFALLASLYTSFQPFVFYGRDGRPRIDWTDFNATRELTRVLLLHDHGIHWYFLLEASSFTCSFLGSSVFSLKKLGLCLRVSLLWSCLYVKIGKFVFFNLLRGYPVCEFRLFFVVIVLSCL